MGHGCVCYHCHELGHGRGHTHSHGRGHTHVVSLSPLFVLSLPVCGVFLLIINLDKNILESLDTKGLRHLVVMLSL